MKHKLTLPVVLSFCAVVLVLASLGIWQWVQHMPYAQAPADYVAPPPAPLVTNDSVPIGLIGTVTAIGTSTITIEGQPPGNTEPVTLTVLVDAKTSITKVGPAPDYATSTVKFTGLTKGMLLNIAATEARGGVRHAERIIIPPPAQ